MTPACVARTVFDARSKDPKYAQQVLLLLASWHACANDGVPLELLIVGPELKGVTDFALALGATVHQSEPIACDELSKASNKILGATGGSSASEVLLLDNDVWFSSRPDLRPFVGKRTIFGCTAGRERVTPAQWAVMSSELGLNPLPSHAVPLQERLSSLLEGRPPRAIDQYYINSGVLLLPDARDLADAWVSHLMRLARHFQAHPLRSKEMCGSDQTALATAAGQFGSAAYMPEGFNYRPVSFALGLVESPDSVHLVHMVGSSERRNADEPLSACLRRYWTVRVDRLLEQLDGHLPKPDIDDRRALSAWAFARMLAIAHDYDLDRVYQRCVQES